jgi:hypothetical protein
MQFSVPQFVDIENKIIGPITVRQFILMAIAVAIIFFAFKYLDRGAFILVTILAVGVFGVLAFVKVNGRPFHFFLLSVLQAVKSPAIRVWKKESIPVQTAAKGKAPIKDVPQITYVKILREKEAARSRISDLSLLVDTGGYYGK